MSNRRRPRLTADLKAYAARHRDHGCGECDPELEVRPHPGEPSIVMLAIRHDDDCPVLAEKNPTRRRPLW